MENRRKGEQGEKLALEHLIKAGYEPLARNVRLGHNEIDIIIRDGDTIVFVEVKARSSVRYGLPREAVGAKKQAALIRAAYEYLMKCPPDTKARFDVVEVDLFRQTVNHIINAFMAN